MEQTDLFNLGRYKIKTYNVSLVAEPTAAIAFGEYAGRPARSSQDCYHLAKSLFDGLALDVDREHFLLLCLNNKNRLEGFKLISTGSLTSSLVHPREVYHAAITLHAAAVIFVHNHPSGDPAPSQEDIELTRRLKQVAEVMGIRVLDHVVLGNDRFWSFSDKGML